MLFRCAILVGLGSVVATIIYLTPIPEQTFLSCDRPCHHLDWPMICRVKLTLEVFQSLSKSCGDCPRNETDCRANHCVSADGQRRGIFTANRQLPGPSIQVCENDILVVDVINRLPGMAASIHWRGQSQIETPYMDGAPLVTQCPIPSYTTFQYKFRASVPGTHLWHAHAGADVTNGVFGSLIVRQAGIRDPHRALYDTDEPGHVILVTQWPGSGQGDARPPILLINGKGRRPDGPDVPFTAFSVIPGRRHRFRLANAGGAGACPVTLSVDAHPVLLITLDGHPVEPRQVASVTLAKGERADVVLKANKRIASYWVNVHTTKDCEDGLIYGAAILKYKGATAEAPVSMTDAIDQESSSTTTEESTRNHRPALTSLADKCENPGNLCVTELQALQKMPKSLSNPKPDVTVYLPVNYKLQATELLDTAGTDARVLSVDNATFTYPSSPLLTQSGDVSPVILCSRSSDEEHTESNETAPSPRRCRRGDGTVTDTCECVHVRRIPLGATVEIILLDQGGMNNLVYHLHGYSFYVVAARKFGRAMSVEELKSLDKRGLLFTRNLDCTPIKDTVVVPKYGAVALRFKADNPGYWMLRDEHASDWTRGLDVVLQVGEPGEMIPAPQDFPKCGSFVGPEYFLI